MLFIKTIKELLKRFNVYKFRLSKFKLQSFLYTYSWVYFSAYVGACVQWLNTEGEIILLISFDCGI